MTCAHLWTMTRTTSPNGLVFSYDDDFLIDINYDSEDERLRSSFPKNKSQMNIIPGGPEPPDLSKYPKSEQDAVLAAYLVKRKAFTDKDCHRCVKKSKLEAKLSGTVSGAYRISRGISNT
jgi:hypothetical protein